MTGIRITRFRSELAGKRFLHTNSEGTLIPELLDFNIHNWVTTPGIENIWESDVTTGRVVVEERWSLVKIPFRKFTLNITGMNLEDSKYLWAKIQRLANKSLLLPVYPDMIKLSSAVTAGGTNISGDFTDYRYFPGVKCIVVSWDSNRKPTDIEVVTVQSITSSDIIIESPGFANNHAAGSRIYPLFTTDPELTYDLRFMSNHVYDLVATFPEKHDGSAIPPWTPTGNDPHGQTFEQVPLFPYNFNRVVPPTMTLTHAGTKQRIGRGFITTKQTDRPRIGFSFNTTFLTRSEAADALRFMDSRRGRTHKFWFANIGVFWTVSNAGQYSVTVNTDIDISDMTAFVKAICIVMNDGTKIIRKITAYNQVSATSVQLFFADAAGNGQEVEAKFQIAEDMNYVCPAYLCRNVKDVYNENWITNEKLSIDQDIIEIQDERDIRIPGISDLVRPVVPNLISDCDLYLVAGSNSEKDDTTAVSVDGDEIAKWKNLASDGSKYLFYDAAVFGTFGRYYYETSGVFPYRPENWGVFTNPDKPGFLLNETRPLHDNGLGMTIFMTMRNYANPTYLGPDDCLVAYPNSGYVNSDIFIWTKTGVTMNQNEGIDNLDNNIITTDVGEDHSSYVTVAFIWKPGKFAQVYQNGIRLGTAPKPVEEMPMDLDLPPMFVRMANEPGDSDSADDNSVKHIAVFPRALTLDEFNAVGTSLGNQISVNWGKVLSFYE